MAFNLKKVLKALLLSSTQPLTAKDIQEAFTRFHESALPLAPAEDTPVAPDAPAQAPEGVTMAPWSPPGGAAEAAEVFAEPPQDPELYADVPTLVTATHELDIVPIIAERVVVIGEERRILADGTPDAILADRELLVRANLIHEHAHRHRSMTPQGRYGGDPGGAAGGTGTSSGMTTHRMR